MLDWILNICKIAGVIVGGLAGLIGTAAKTRDDDDKLTTPGKWLLGVVIGGFLLALASQATELLQQQASARNAAQQNENLLQSLQKQASESRRILDTLQQQSDEQSKTLAEVKRARTRIDSVSLYTKVYIPVEGQLSAYRSRVLERAASLADSEWQTLHRADVLGLMKVITRDGQSKIDGFGAAINGTYGPRSLGFPLADLVVRSLALQVEVYSAEKPAFDSGGELVATFLPVVRAFPSAVRDSNFTVWSDRGPAEIFKFVTSEPRHWTLSGRFTSLSDLVGTQVLVAVSFVAKPGAELNSEFFEILDRVEFEPPTLEINHIPFDLQCAKCIYRGHFPVGTPVAVYQLPTSESELLKLAEHP